ncbi:MAG: aldehyde dehydrogenase [Nocardioidaceae bacterium]|nr:aldehyde dehydrogenase [Nocardioidaceae bacterium]
MTTPTATLDAGLPDGRLLIAGDWRSGTGAELESINPFDGSLNRTFAGASPDDVDEAVTRGREAMDEPAWRDLLPHERARYLHRVADHIEDRVDRIAAIQTADTGKTLTETAALARSAAGTFRYFAAVLEVAEDTLTPRRGDFLTMSVHEPLGVIAAITPWNSPIASDAQKVAPALAAGNAVVLKPASWAPLVALELAAIVDAAGLPAGLFSVLPGSGRETGEAIIEHPLVRRISFTGGTTTGRHIADVAARRLIPTSLELGGKSPTVVFADADVDQAIAGVLFGIFSSQGQSCIAGSRLFVETSMHDEFVERLAAATDDLVLGDPTVPGVQLGPLVHFDHRLDVERYIAAGVDEGGRVVSGGARPTGPPFDAGAFLSPTILTGVDNASAVCQEEIFGPVLVTLPFDDEDDLVAQANDSVYGLAAGIWTADYRRAWRVARRIDAGTVWINTYKQFSISTPFGGTKDSGWGREKGVAGIRQYQHQKSLYWGMDPSPHAWAAPHRGDGDGPSRPEGTREGRTS